MARTHMHSDLAATDTLATVEGSNCGLSIYTFSFFKTAAGISIHSQKEITIMI